MRRKAQNGPLSVHAIAGSYVTLLGINMEEASAQGILGFAIERIDHSRDDRRDWLAGFKTFPGSNIPKGALVSTHEHPIQSFQWCDFTTRKTMSTHIESLQCEAPRCANGGEDISVKIQMENEDEGTHAVYFNRGVAASDNSDGVGEDKRPVSALIPDDSWHISYYRQGTVKQKERLYFA